MKTLLLKFTALLFVISLLAGCEPPEPTMFGIPQSQWYTLTKTQQNQVIEGYNRQQEINAQNAPAEAAIAVAGAAVVADDDDYYNSYRYRHDYYRRHGFYPQWHHDHHDRHDRHDYHPEPPRPGPMPPRPFPPGPIPPAPTPDHHGHSHGGNPIPVIFPDSHKKHHHEENSIPIIKQDGDKKLDDFKSLIR